jgi:hypothetical protein
MKSRKTTHKTAPKQAPAPLRDPRLVALLMFLDDCSGDDDEGSVAASYAAALADADAMLTSHPLTTSFACYLDRPEFKDLVTRAVTEGRGDYQREKSLNRQIQSEHGNDDDLITGTRIELKGLVWCYADAAMLRGACLMYRLLTGGTR